MSAFEFSLQAFEGGAVGGGAFGGGQFFVVLVPVKQQHHDHGHHQHGHERVRLGIGGLLRNHAEKLGARGMAEIGHRHVNGELRC